MDKKLEILKINKLQDAQNIYESLFDDSKEFSDYFFNQYSNNCIYYGGYLNNELVFITTMVKKRVFLDGIKQNCYLIVGVGTKSSHQKKGLMKYFLSEIISLYSENNPIFIQSYDWPKYKSFDFYPCTVKSTWVLKKDQILHKKKDNLLENVDYDLVNKIRNEFNKNNKIENFSYRTSKENKKILKMHELGGDKIYLTNRAYIIKANDYIIDYGFIELIDLIKLSSNFEYGLKIRSFIDLDKKFFARVDDVDWIETKIYKRKNIAINFSEFF